jgi:DNA-binding transcriptional ArsR family regulator
MVHQSPTLDRVFHALADGTRRDIVDRLSRNSLTVSDLAAPLPMSLAAVMQHIAVLEKAGLVTSRKAGRVRTCTIEAETLAQAEHWLESRRALWARRLDRLGKLLDQQNEQLENQQSESEPNQ